MNELQKATVAAIVNVFETGRVRGDYGAIAVLKGDSGHLSYGRSQTTLGSGNLYKLLNLYCQQATALFADPLKPYLSRFQRRDFTLDTDQTVRLLLQQAGREDPAMRATQDQFFNTEYFAPASHHAEACGISLPLGLAIVYDSGIQGGWDKLRTRVGAVATNGQEAWLGRYVNERRKWLSGLKPPLPSTTYRMDTFQTLITGNAWDLPIPLKVHGVTITEEAMMSGDRPLPGRARRRLKLTSPYLRGDDVDALQQALKAKGIDSVVDHVYGPLTDVLVKKWQQQNGIHEDGAGAATLKSLGL
jgi:chitosanase